MANGAKLSTAQKAARNVRSDSELQQERGDPKGAKKRRHRLFVYKQLQELKVLRLSCQ
jgi:hypothetical protein